MLTLKLKKTTQNKTKKTLTCFWSCSNILFQTFLVSINTSCPYLGVPLDNIPDKNVLLKHCCIFWHKTLQFGLCLIKLSSLGRAEDMMFYISSKFYFKQFMLNTKQHILSTSASNMAALSVWHCSCTSTIISEGIVQCGRWTRVRHRTSLQNTRVHGLMLILCFVYSMIVSCTWPRSFVPINRSKLQPLRKKKKTSSKVISEMSVSMIYVEKLNRCCTFIIITNFKAEPCMCTGTEQNAEFDKWEHFVPGRQTLLKLLTVPADHVLLLVTVFLWWT